MRAPQTISNDVPGWSRVPVFGVPSYHTPPTSGIRLLFAPLPHCDRTALQPPASTLAPHHDEDRLKEQLGYVEGWFRRKQASMHTASGCPQLVSRHSVCRLPVTLLAEDSPGGIFLKQGSASRTCSPLPVPTPSPVYRSLWWGVAGNTVIYENHHPGFGIAGDQKNMGVGWGSNLVGGQGWRVPACPIWRVGGV